MSNTETRPDVTVCAAGGGAAVQVIGPRDVPLGGTRAMHVRRTLPAKGRTLIGAWCFLDHYGPEDVRQTGGMQVPPHPHTGLQTVTWLFSGEVEHADSLGNVARLLPGEINLMTAGRGISHAENSVPAERPVMHGVQLWIALPDAARHTTPALAHHAPTAVTGPGWQARVFLGSLLGDTAPIRTFSPVLGAELVLEPGTSLTIDVAADFEHGVLVDTGNAALSADGGEAAPVAKDYLAYAPQGASSLTLTAGGDLTRLLLLGGPPFGEQILMWWNFVGRSHEEIVAFRDEWQRQITRGGGAAVADSAEMLDGRFGTVAANHQRPIPAPPLPSVRLLPRR